MIFKGIENGSLVYMLTANKFCKFSPIFTLCTKNLNEYKLFKNIRII